MPDHLLHAAFLSIMHKIATHARISFRHIKCPEKKADRIAETIALAWCWFRRLARRGGWASFRSARPRAGSGIKKHHKPSRMLGGTTR